MSDAFAGPGSKLLEVMKEVRRNVSSSELRSLWEKMQEEMKQGGPDAALDYLTGEFDRCRLSFAKELEILEAEFSRKSPL